MYLTIIIAYFVLWACWLLNMSYWIIMLANRLQITSSLLFQNQFAFATKNLKQIKIRMKAVESIKKITKVH